MRNWPERPISSWMNRGWWSVFKRSSSLTSGRQRSNRRPVTSCAGSARFYAGGKTRSGWKGIPVTCPSGPTVSPQLGAFGQQGHQCHQVPY